MQIGDKIYCRRTLTHFKKDFFTKGKSYEIITINRTSIGISDDRFEISQFLLYTPNDNEYQLEDYFCTKITDIRKLKLDKINENNLQ